MVMEWKMGALLGGRKSCGFREESATLASAKPKIDGQPCLPRCRPSSNHDFDNSDSNGMEDAKEDAISGQHDC